MGALAVIGIVLLSGASAGLVHGAVNLALVEPFLDSAIELENEALFEAGLAEDTPAFRAEYGEYRSWQKSGMVAASVVLGTSVGALFGAVFALSRGSLPGRGDLAKALALAGLMWAVLFAVPSLKYPADLPGAGDPDTVGDRAALYAALVATSGLGAALFYRVSRMLGGSRRLLAPAGYAGLVAAAFAVLPDGAVGGAAPQGLVDGFRAASAVGTASFWVSVAAARGLLWPRLAERRAGA